ncbi:hypothetical protein [Paenibacillus lemnae]|uniref:Uncharacterized protein n=1 Tax=Paenibacillus lemnae TaxID=1330551 RepID=A0A848M4M6_PAELE|nr:hypothetical protein [Paenibacillus lemnae]NMO95877.1 hypothetical protein [Paenibacillus lemnae]
MPPFNIKRAAMQLDDESRFVGSTIFEVEGHTGAYEITFLSKNGKDWDYSLHFADEPGPEEQFLLIDAQLEENEDLFDDLLDAAVEAGGF